MVYIGKPQWMKRKSEAEPIADAVDAEGAEGEAASTMAEPVASSSVVAPMPAAVSATAESSPQRGSSTLPAPSAVSDATVPVGGPLGLQWK